MPRNRTRRRADSATLNGSSSAALPPRSKAGCWTCRIRRKRCDEQQDESGSCQACVRLDIECLGWGTRRPDWCRDKEKLNQYKLSLKRKLCSRAGTRPSASKPAQHPHALTRQSASTTAGNVDLTRATSGESPVVSSSSINGGEDDEELETDDYYSSTPFTPATNTLPGDSPTLFFSPQLQHPETHWQSLPAAVLSQPTAHYPKQKPSPLSIIAPNLSALLATSSSSANIPAEYATLISQLIDLHLYKSRLFSKQSSSSSSSGAAEQEIAHRAQAIEVELSRLSNRATFDSLFSSALGGGGGGSGFGFDTSIFLAATTSPSSVVGNGGDIFNSPMTMWSPDLMSDAMSTFSGSSAPTSPAAPLLAMASNSYSFNDFLGYDHNNNLSLFDSSSYMSVPQQQHQSMTNMGMGGALGLSSDFMLNDGYATTGATPSISVLPPTRTATLEMDMTKTAPSLTPAQDIDPFQIHHETCTLLLQAVLSNESPTSTTFDSVSSPFSLETSSPIEDCLQRLTTKFSPLVVQQGPGIPAEYLFSATLAGAMSSSNGRRALFREIVRGIEERSGSVIGLTLLNEAWAN